MYFNGLWYSSRSIGTRFIGLNYSSCLEFLSNTIQYLIMFLYHLFYHLLIYSFKSPYKIFTFDFVPGIPYSTLIHETSMIHQLAEHIGDLLKHTSSPDEPGQAILYPKQTILIR